MVTAVTTPREIAAMSAEHSILYIAGGILASITAIRFILQELTTVVLLYKQLKATIRSDLPSQPPQLVERTGSKRELT
jgi:hypothetical protein